MIVFSSLLLATTFQVGLQLLDPDVDFVRPETRSRLGNPQPGNLTGWHSSSLGTLYSRSQIPPILLANADTWIRRCVRAEFVSPSLALGFKGCRYPKSDVIYARYQSPASLKIQLSENEVAVGIVLKCSDQPSNLSDSAVGEFVKRVARLFVNYSPTQQEQMTISIKHFELPRPQGFWKGTLHVEDQGLALEQMGWWNQVSFATDGDTIAFDFIKWLPGDHPMTGAGGGYPTDQPYRGRFDRVPD